MSKLTRNLGTLTTVLCLASTALGMKINSDRADVHLETQKVTLMRGPVTPEMYISVMQQMLVTSQIPGDRILVINSPGGSEDAGSGIIDLMEAEKLLHVRQICIVNHQAESMAFNILTHCDVRLATTTSTIMAHVLALQGVECLLHRCTPTYLRSTAEDLAIADLPYRKDNAAALMLTPKQYDEYAAKDYVWPIRDLLKRGYLHAVILVK